MSGTGVTAGSQRGEALNVHAKQTSDEPGLGLAQLGELSRNVLHRAVALAQLQHGERTGRDRPGGGGVAISAQREGERLSASRDVRPCRVNDLAVAGLNGLHASLGKVFHRRRTEHGCQMRERGSGESCGSVGKVPLGRRRCHILAGWAASATRAGARGRPLHDLSHGDQGPKVTADSRRCEIEQLRELRGPNGALGDDEGPHAIARTNIAIGIKDCLGKTEGSWALVSGHDGRRTGTWVGGHTLSHGTHFRLDTARSGSWIAAHKTRLGHIVVP